MDGCFVQSKAMPVSIRYLGERGRGRGRGFGSLAYIKLVSVSHQRIVQQMPIYLKLDQKKKSVSISQNVTSSFYPPAVLNRHRHQQTHLGLDQDQVDEQDDVVVLDILVAEATAVLADRQADVVAAGPRPQRLNRMTAFYADRHRAARGGGCCCCRERAGARSDWCLFNHVSRDDSWGSIFCSKVWRKRVKY